MYALLWCTCFHVLLFLFYFVLHIVHFFCTVCLSLHYLAWDNECKFACLLTPGCLHQLLMFINVLCPYQTNKQTSKWINWIVFVYLRLSGQFKEEWMSWLCVSEREPLSVIDCKLQITHIPSSIDVEHNDSLTVDLYIIIESGKAKKTNKKQTNKTWVPDLVFRDPCTVMYRSVWEASEQEVL